ncbi:hypothetical protein QLX67_06920 [Balneolaceae bacterium ANBcel3]|nr:hypothetical protein [Balneolaceae bacterium ANBcel3]
MSKIRVFANDRFEIYCYPNEKIIHHIIKKFVHGEDFKQLMTKGADAFIKFSCTKWLSDDRSSSVLKKEDVEWGQKNWEPRILQKGWKYWAIVMPDSTIGKMTMNPVIKRYASLGVKVEIVRSADQGVQWLKSQV